MNIDQGEGLLSGTEIRFYLTSNKMEAESEKNPVQGPGPWWMCQITSMVECCPHCHVKRPEGYFKASAHSLELALALATVRLENFRILARTEGQSASPATPEERQPKENPKP